MSFLPTEMDLVLVSAGAALIIGSAVRLFGSRWLFDSLRHIVGFVLRRRGVSTALLGAAASTGLAAASALGVQPVEMGDAVSWFQSQVSGLTGAAQWLEAARD
ncbi:hypothetical protein [Hyphobacterium indicum]|uniref:hypothetical protein n=1 Tax=Hyphobacterium indicum TaxID=2162714 RepID=UPI000D654199|nr:hypothetical protein [Hyphobacterium indicum]